VVGPRVGAFVVIGPGVGLIVGSSLRLCVGSPVVVNVVGDRLGSIERISTEGCSVGIVSVVGVKVGFIEGRGVGDDVGSAEGTFDGESVGC